MKYNTGKQLKILILIAICFSICGCDRATADPHIAYGLLLKCRDFLSFCLFLTNQEKPYFNHIAQRYYYATLLLASITYQWQKKQGREFVVFSKHEDVWKIMPHNIKQTYGDKLKKLRNRCDYIYDDKFDNSNFRSELYSIVCENPDVFPQLKDKAMKDCEKFFYDMPCCELTKESCQILLEEIEKINIELRKSLQKQNHS